MLETNAGSLNWLSLGLNNILLEMFAHTCRFIIAVSGFYRNVCTKVHNKLAKYGLGSQQEKLKILSSIEMEFTHAVTIATVLISRKRKETK